MAVVWHCESARMPCPLGDSLKLILYCFLLFFGFAATAWPPTNASSTSGWWNSSKMVHGRMAAQVHRSRSTFTCSKTAKRNHRHCRRSPAFCVALQSNRSATTKQVHPHRAVQSPFTIRMHPTSSLTKHWTHRMSFVQKTIAWSRITQSAPPHELKTTIRIRKT